LRNTYQFNSQEISGWAKLVIENHESETRRPQNVFPGLETSHDTEHEGTRSYLKYGSALSKDEIAI
jgi:hypothetical protein